MGKHTTRSDEVPTRTVTLHFVGASEVEALMSHVFDSERDALYRSEEIGGNVYTATVKVTAGMLTAIQPV